MTAEVTVIGTGRVLNHPELVGRSLCYFLTVTFAGQTFRWCFPSARDIWVSAVDGESYHFQGMDFPQMSQSFDFDSDSPVDVSVSFEDLTFPGDIDLPRLLANGHRLERAAAELAVLPDFEDALWSARYIVLLGEVRDPVYGDPETHANAVGFTVDAPSWEDSALFPPVEWIVTTDEWPNADPEAIGKVFPFVFGQPGSLSSLRLGIGIASPRKSTPGLCVDNDRYMFAGHLVAPNTYESTTIFVLQHFWDETSGQFFTWNGLTGPRLELATTLGGFQYTSATFTGLTGYTRGDEIWCEHWTLNSVSPYRSTLGGYPNFEWDGPLITAGDVLYFMLLQSSLKVDRGRTAVAQALLQSFKVSGYIDERVTPYDWLVDNLLPILPIAMSQGPKGVFPIVWRYDAGPTDCVGSFIEGPRWRRVSSLERDDSTIINKYTLAYGLDGSDFLLKFGIDGSLNGPDEAEEAGVDIVSNLFARRSYLEHGQIAVEESSDLVTTAETAAAICAWKIRANAFAKRIVTYEATAEHAWLEPGDPILVTDPDLFFDEQVCLVRTKTWDVTSVLYELLILTDPVRDVVQATVSADSELTGTPEFLLMLHMDDFINDDILGPLYADTGEFLFTALALPVAVLSGAPVFGADSADLTGGSYVEIDISDGGGDIEWNVLGTSPALTIDLYETWSGSFSGTKRVFACRKTDTHGFFLTVDSSGFPHVESEGGANLSLVSNTPLVAGQKTLIRFSTHAGQASLWMGVVGDTFATCVATGADTTTWSEASVGHLVQIHGDYGGGNGGNGNVDEVAVMMSVYESDMTIGATTLMPTTAWVAPND